MSELSPQDWEQLFAVIGTIVFFAVTTKIACVAAGMMRKY